MRSPWPTRWATPSYSTRHASSRSIASDVMAMGARLSAYTATLESGPLAVFGTDPALVFIPHPVQDRTDAELHKLADDHFDAIVRLLTT